MLFWIPAFAGMTSGGDMRGWGLLLLGAIALAGCATPMTMREIDAVRPNCASIDRQIATLEQEKAKNDQRILAGVQSVAPALAEVAA